MKLTVNLKGLEQAKKILADIPVRTRGAFLRAVGEYLLGDESHGLRHYAPWKKVTRKSVYGSSFFSDKQRRAFFAKLKSGEINVPYTRTGAQGKGWKIVGTSTNIRLANSDKSVKFTRGQTRLHARMGWQTVAETVQSNIKGAIRAGKAAILSALKR